MNSRRGSVPLVAPRSRRQIALTAVQVIHRFRPDLLSNPGPFPIEEFWDLGLPAYGIQGYVSDSLGPFDEGITRPDGTIELSSAVFDDLGIGDGRARFTVGHECGHGLLHVNEIKEALVSGRQPGLRRSQEIPVYRHPEWQADEFASFLLMPGSAVKALVSRPGGETGEATIKEMMVTFGVSFRAAEVRLSKMTLHS